MRSPFEQSLIVNQLNSQQAAALDFDDDGTVNFGDAVALAFE